MAEKGYFFPLIQLSFPFPLELFRKENRTVSSSEEGTSVTEKTAQICQRGHILPLFAKNNEQCCNELDAQEVYTFQKRIPHTNPLVHRNLFAPFAQHFATTTLSCTLLSRSLMRKREGRGSVLAINSPIKDLKVRKNVNGRQLDQHCNAFIYLFFQFLNIY